MARLGQVDFGDQIVESLRLFRTRPHVLRRYQERFKYILVDEFQDTNYAQFELVKLLAARNRNVAVVGDDDQAIFRFRGASMSNILDFDRTYPDARKVVLQENRRSPAGHPRRGVPAHPAQQSRPARGRAADRQAADRQGAGRGERLGKAPEHLAFDTLSSESDHVASMIAEGHEAGRPLKDFAMLVRANHDADAYLRALNMRGHPVDLLGERRALRPARGATPHRVPAGGGAARRVGEPALPGLVGRLPGAHRRPHKVRHVRHRRNRTLFDVLREPPADAAS